MARNNSAEIAAFHEGRKDEPSIMEDPRSPQMAQAVLAEVVRLNAEGRSNEARALFDPAHAPFISQLEKAGRGLTFCAILGPDEFLVQQGTHYTENTTWHIQGDRITQASPLAGFAWSRNRQHFLAVQPDGAITLHKTYSAPPHDLIPAVRGSAFIPTDLSRELRAQYETPDDAAGYSHLAISDDGQKILLCDAERGIVVLTKGDAGWAVQLIFPSISLGLEEEMHEAIEDGEDFRPFFDMMHAALSPDGQFAALGTQDDGHHVLSLKGREAPAVYAKLGYLSEYPHDACFSNDGAFVALNSCHFYNGVTFASEMATIQGLTTSPYEEHPAQTILNNYLRVYASSYLPGSMTAEQTGAFLLAGSGFAACVTEKAELLWEVGFGSSAGGVDVCPQTGRVLIASYSGMLHLLDPSQPQSPPIFSGYNAPQELRRWLFWERLEQPIAW